MKFVYVVVTANYEDHIAPIIDVFSNEKDALDFYNMYTPSDGKVYAINDGAGTSPGHVTVDATTKTTYTIQKKKVTTYDEEEHTGHDWGYQ